MSGPRNFRAHLEIHREMQPLQVYPVSNRKLEDVDENVVYDMQGGCFDFFHVEDGKIQTIKVNVSV